MVIEIKKWGNSLGLRIPRDIARNLGLEEGSEVEVGLEGGAMVIRSKSGLVIEPAKGKFGAHQLELIKGKPGGKTVVQIIREMRDEGW